MAISNQLNVVFNHNQIDDCYDFYLITTSDKYISGGAYILDKPIDVLKAESVVFDNGRSLFIMFKKDAISRFDLIDQLIDEKLSIKQVKSSDIKDYILLRLFLFSTNNFEVDENKFNNISGKLYITKAKWMSKNKKTFKALNINVDENLCVTAEAVTFTSCSFIKNKRILNEYPKYVFSNKNGALKRTFEINNEDVYVRKSIFGKKAEIVFLDFSKGNIKNSKVYFIYKTIDILKTKFSNCLNLNFKSIDVLDSIGKFRDKDFIEHCIDLLKGKTLNVVDWSNSQEYCEEFNSLLDVLTSKNIFDIKVSNAIKRDCLNLVYLHNKEYYEQNKYNDPYKNFDSDAVIQHITIEDCADKLVNDNEAIFYSILKEYVIKNDILFSKNISLDQWNALGYKSKLVFGREKNNKHYFMIINPDGTFEFKNKINDFASFKDPLLDKCSNLLTDNRGKEKSIIASSDGILVLSRNGKYILPSEKLFALDEISRDFNSRKELFEGVVDINLFKDNGKDAFNAGIKGSGMNTSIPKASVLYYVDVVEGINFIKEVVKLMAVPFVKFKSFTVLPYPFKYLNEYIEQCEKGAEHFYKR